MIKVDVLKAKEHMMISNSPFYEGQLYFGRRSKNGTHYLVTNGFKDWLPVNDLEEKFEKHSFFLTKRRQDLRDMRVEEMKMKSELPCRELGWNFTITDVPNLPKENAKYKWSNGQWKRYEFLAKYCVDNRLSEISWKDERVREGRI
jgi:hypothetical protein